MKIVNIFVEGIADQVFLRDLIHVHFGFDFQNSFQFKNQDLLIDFLRTDGWEKIADDVNVRNFEKGDVNLVVFDADDEKKDPEYGGLEKRSKRVRELLNSKEVKNEKVKAFFYANGNGEGDLETLLLQIFNEQKRELIESCYNDFESCVAKIPVPQNGHLTMPNRKTRVYTYVSTFLPASETQQKKAKEPNRNYKDVNFWNLQHFALSSLVHFLKTNLQ